MGSVKIKNSNQMEAKMDDYHNAPQGMDGYYDGTNGLVAYEDYEWGNFPYTKVQQDMIENDTMYTIIGLGTVLFLFSLPVVIPLTFEFLLPFFCF
jgi:hypothetical protein